MVCSNWYPHASQDHTFRIQRSDRCSDHSGATIAPPHCAHWMTGPVSMGASHCLPTPTRGPSQFPATLTRNFTQNLRRGIAPTKPSIFGGGGGHEGDLNEKAR